MSDTEFMKNLEYRYKEKTGYTDRSIYKIYYCSIHKAPIMVLGLNPGGEPESHSKDGMLNYSTGKAACSSQSFHENNEHDLLDCDWADNKILDLFYPGIILQKSDARNLIVKTNCAFYRSKKSIPSEFETEFSKSLPFLLKIIDRVSPTVIIFTFGNSVERVARRLFDEIAVIEAPEKRVNQSVFGHAKGRLQNGRNVHLIEVAHPSQFSWIYREKDLLGRTVSSRLFDVICEEIPSWPHLPTKQPRATSILRRPAVKLSLVADRITLDHEARGRRRLAMTSDGGLAFLLDLARPMAIEDGDALVLEDGRLIEVRAADEALIEITAGTPLRLAKIAWHLGNRHTPAEVTEDAIYVAPDHVLAEMVRGLGGSAREVRRPFRPERGAYHSHEPDQG